jgi:hypothetical protein
MKEIVLYMCDIIEAEAQSLQVQNRVHSAVLGIFSYELKFSQKNEKR